MRTISVGGVVKPKPRITVAWAPVTTRLEPDPVACGFPNVLLGGYLAALAVDGEPGWVSLRRPVAPGTPLQRVDDKVVQADGRVVASIKLGAVSADGPPPPALDVARRATPLWREVGHPVAGCFSCGIDPPTGRGLRVAVGRLDGGGVEAGVEAEVVAGVWVPPVAEATPTGAIPVPLLWAALDCCGFWALALDPPNVAAVVTRRIGGTVLAAARAGEEHILAAWPDRASGDSLSVAAAIYRGDGTLVAVVRQELAAAAWGFPVGILRQ